MMSNLFKKTALQISISSLAVALAAPIANAAMIEEVVVTAQKREQNLQDVGLSVTALDSKGMDRAGIQDVSRIELVTPGVTFSFNGSDSKVAIRGANSDNTFGDNSSIAGFFVDGVYRPRASQQSQAFFDVSRIEVLKGPQGTLYGRNTFAGAINLYTNAPELEELSGGAKTSYSRFNKFTTEAFINIPITEDLAVRIAGNTKDSDGYIKNRGAGEDLGQEEARNIRFSALWAPSDSIEAILRYTSLSEKGVTPGIFSAEGLCQPINSNGITDAFGQFENCGNPDTRSSGDSFFDEPYKVAYNEDLNRDNSEQNTTLDINWDINDSLQLRSITSYTDFDSGFVADSEWSNAFGNSYWWDEEVQSTTQELQLISDSGESLKWTAGLYYSVDVLGFGFAAWEAGASSLGAASYADFQDIKTKTIGIFIQGEYSITDEIRLIAGIRHNNEVKDTKNFQGYSTDVNGNALPGISLGNALPSRAREIFRYVPGAKNQQEFEKVTWKVGGEYDMNENILLYANASTGFLSGGFNGDTTSFEEQESIAYEAGIKSRWLDDSVQLNVSLYSNEFTNLVSQKLLANDTTVSVNSGEIDARGLDAELTWLPDDHWYISATLSLLDSEFGEFALGNNFASANGDTTANFIDLDGYTPPLAPDMTVSLSVGYDIDLGSLGHLTPFLQVYYSDEYNTDNLVTYDQQVQESYTKTDMRLIWESPSETVSAEIFVENIEDEAVLARTNVGGDAIVQSSYLYPRNYGIKLSYSF